MANMRMHPYDHMHGKVLAYVAGNAILEAQIAHGFMHAHVCACAVGAAAGLNLKPRHALG